MTINDPCCTICSKQIQTMELLNVHMKNNHNDSDNDRITRLTETVQKYLNSEVPTKLPIFDCSECGVIFKTSNEQNDHNKTHHTCLQESNIVCELCDKVFLTRKEKSSHKMFVHTVSTETMKCEYCGEQCHGLEEICNHITLKHKDKMPLRCIEKKSPPL